MYVYVDESGNTGYRIFDPDQPVFVTAALMTKTNFDLTQAAAVAGVARKAGVPALHASALGANGVEAIADDLSRIIKRADARFFVSRLEKRYLAAAKVFDTYFDAGENDAMPWHAYWVRPLRLTLMFKIALYVLTEEIAQVVLDCVTAPSEEKSKERFRTGAELLLARVQRLPDARSRELITGALQWALAHPDAFATHLRDKTSRNGHAPNFVAFTNLMRGIDQAARAWKRPVREIVHDRQSQFEKSLIQWHDIYARPELAGVEPISWPGEDAPFSPAQVTGSTFRMACEEESAGLQVVDVVLWLFKRALAGKEIGPRSAALLQRVYRRGYQNDLSFDGVGAQVEQKLNDIYAAPVSQDALERGAAMIAAAEDKRRAALADCEGP
jgi:hypothetical protein